MTLQPVRAATGRYTAVAVVLHWLMALGIIGMLALGFYMKSDLVPDKSTKFALIQIHKSIGVVLLWLIAVRLAWRLTHKAPELAGPYPKWERALATLGHIALYILMIGMPLSGWIIVSTSAFGLPTMLFFTNIEWPHLAFLSGNDAAHEASETAHYWLAWVFIATIAGHALAVAKHWLIDRENIVVRMWFPMKRNAQKLALIAALALTAGAVQAKPYTVDYTQSKLGFSGVYSDKPFTGEFRKWTATIDFDAANIAATKIEAVIDTASAVTGSATNDAALPSADWFDVKTYPQATFKADSVEAKGDGNYLAHGTLTLKGKPQKLDLGFVLTPAAASGPTTVTAAATLDRLQSGIGVKSDPTGEWVGKEIKLALTLKATPQ